MWRRLKRLWELSGTTHRTETALHHHIRLDGNTIHRVLREYERQGLR